jgi:hypothetical protein
VKVLDLFAGTRSIAKVADERGHESFSIEKDTIHENIDWYTDILDVTASDIVERFGRPDVIWASPPCTSYSIAGISHHREKRGTDSHLYPVSDFAFLSDEILLHTIQLIMDLQPLYWFIENPRGGLRKMSFMQDLPRYTVTYCQYGDTRMKPTDLWTNHPAPNFKPMCKNGDTCHDRAPRGSRTGTQGLSSVVAKSVVPRDLCTHIISISEGSYT